MGGARTRTVEDEKTGWVYFAPGPKAVLKPWKKTYVCKAAIDITPDLKVPDGAAAAGARKTEAGATYIVVDGPCIDPSSQQRRVRLSSVEEGVVGWATLRGADGKVF